MGTSLRGSARGGTGTPWGGRRYSTPIRAANCDLHRNARRRQDQNLYGRPRSLFMERLWRSLKYEDVYLRDYADCLEAKRHRLLDHILQQPTPTSGAARRWRSRATASPARSATRLRTWWTTQELCPHAHSRNNSRRRHSSQHDIRRSKQPRFQLRNRSQWSHVWGPLQQNCLKHSCDVLYLRLHEAALARRRTVQFNLD